MIKRKLSFMFVLVVLSVVLYSTSVFANDGKVGIVNSTNVNVRQNPKTSAKVLTTFDKGSSVTIKSKSNNWYNISKGKISGWILADFITVKTSTSNNNNHATSDTVIGNGKSKVSDLNVRKSPNTNSGIITHLDKGETAGILKVDGSWYKIKTSNGTIGWVLKDYFAIRDSSVSRGNSTTQDNYLLPWFGKVQNLFSIGKTASIYDVDTGLKFNIMRTYGTNHADCEPLTAKDTAIYRKIYDYRSTWDRRAIIVTVDGIKIAASMVGMPHSGVDSKPANAYVKWRSGGFGPGLNLDSIKGNDMDGHFCVHFLGSKGHGSGCVDDAHQKMVKKAGLWAQKNCAR